ncbi:MAG TPA: glycosyl transferase, partial [Spirochaetia bacterium]|nr:glycosyl transferase [Spirochaetia bacterium]
KPDGYDTDRESFLGLNNGYDHPVAVYDGKSRNSVADGWSPIASYMFNLTLAPGEQKELIFTLGYVENEDDEKWERPGVINKKKAQALIKKYGKREDVERSFKELKTYWDTLLDNYKILSALPELNRMVNIWNQYQCIITYHIARSASYFESGVGRGIGFRDTNQDILGSMHQIPALIKERILDVAATQLSNGGAYHQYQPLTKRGNDLIGSNFNDDPLWLILAVSAYLKETGDWAILDQKVDFENNPTLADSLYEHLRRAFNYIVERKGPHGLPLIGRADWNDCLNLNCFSKESGESFQTVTNKDGNTAESVLIAGMFVYIGREYVEIARRRGNKDEAAAAEKEIAAMETAIETHGWDGEWYLRAYDDSSRKVGSNDCEDGKIFIESQGFCSMAQVGKKKGYPITALNAVEKHLATPHGIVLLWPAYTQYYLHLGEISSYPEGYKENGGVFCHNNPWIMIAEAIADRPEKAFDYYKRTAPAFRESISEVHRLEPYVYAQMIAGKEAGRMGEAKNSWLTGTAAWNFVAISQWIIGIRPDYDGLLIDPKLPSDLSDITVERKFRGTRYTIRIRTEKKGATQIVKATCDGEQLPIEPAQPLVIPVQENRSHCTIDIIMGNV